MQEILNLVLTHVRGAWRYRWVVMVVGWIVAVGGWVYVDRIQDTYQASAKVFVDTRTILRPLLNGLAIQSNVNEQLTLMIRLLMTPENLQKIARMADLDLEAKNQDQLDAIAARLQDQIKIRSAERNGIYSISCESNDPQTAKRVVQAVLTLFVEGALGETRRDSDSAQRFIDQQIEQYGRRLEQAELAMAQFQRDNYNFLPGEMGGYYQQLAEITANLEDVKLQLKEAEERRNQLRTQLELEDKTAEDEVLKDLGGFSGDRRTRYDDRIASLEQQRDALLLRFTERHPQVAIIDDSLTELRQLQADEVERMNALAEENSESSASVTDNPVVQQLKISLSEVEAAYVSLVARKQEYERRRDLLQANVDTTLEVETKLKSMNRDYATLKKNYQAFVDRRETAQLSEEVEQRADNVKFKVIEPPKLPKSPVAPNRPLLNTGVLAAGLVGGIGIAVLLSLLRPTFDNRRTLNSVTGFPVLGAVTMIWTPEQTMRRKVKLAVYVLAAVGLLGAYAAVIAVQVLQLNVHKYLSSITGLIL
ncbi:MAG: chain length-determining protein [Chromatiales bacterium]|nr:chain length-determining protein [Chromatiales bacterium]